MRALDHFKPRTKAGWALTPAALLFIAAMFMPPVAQPVDYHAFHDTRTLLGVANFMNVISNAPFVLIGATALVWLESGKAAQTMPGHLRLCYQIMFAGVALTGFGSAWYHLRPDNASLFWDRLPIAMTAMGLFAGFLCEHLRLNRAMGLCVLAACLAYGIGAVFYWSATDDLRFYLIAQFYPLVAIPALLYFATPAYSHSSGWLIALALYVVAKALETADRPISYWLFSLSGHTLKHLAAALAVYWVSRMLTLRKQVPQMPAARP